MTAPTTLKHGDMAFWGDNKPWFIIEYQPDNGPGNYWVVDCEGNSGAAAPSELSKHPPT